MDCNTPTEAEIMVGLLALSKELGPQSTQIDEFLRGRQGPCARAWAPVALMS